jgi:hypothetical protein
VTLTLIPDAEKTISNYLRSHADVVALQTRVVGKPPDSKEDSWVQVTQLGAAQEVASVRDHLIAFMVQFDCYAGADGGQPEANLLGRTIRAALQDIWLTSHPDAVVSACRLIGHARIPDTDLEPSRERVVLTAEVYMHPG